MERAYIDLCLALVNRTIEAETCYLRTRLEDRENELSTLQEQKDYPHMHARIEEQERLFAQEGKDHLSTRELLEGVKERLALLLRRPTVTVPDSRVEDLLQEVESEVEARRLLSEERAGAKSLLAQRLNVPRSEADEVSLASLIDRLWDEGRR
jgi:hypothetical protein